RAGAVGVVDHRHAELRRHRAGRPGQHGEGDARRGGVGSAVGADGVAVDDVDDAVVGLEPVIADHDVAVAVTVLVGDRAHRRAPLGLGVDGDLADADVAAGGEGLAGHAGGGRPALAAVDDHGRVGQAVLGVGDAEVVGGVARALGAAEVV